jgi:hypothetical protein
MSVTLDSVTLKSILIWKNKCFRGGFFFLRARSVNYLLYGLYAMKRPDFGDYSEQAQFF